MKKITCVMKLNCTKLRDIPEILEIMCTGCSHCKECETFIKANEIAKKALISLG